MFPKTHAYLQARPKHPTWQGRKSHNDSCSVDCACSRLVAVAAILLMPGFVDVGFLGWMARPIPVRLALHLPLAVTLLAAGLSVLLVLGATLRFWTPRVEALDVSLAVALTALATQLAYWHLVAWGF